jgi:F-type H+-transporting ATPase subunit epsilon
MAATFHLSLVTATGRVFDGPATAVVLPGVRGSFGILAGHTPLIAALVQGMTKVTTEQGEQHFMVGEGYVDVARNEVSVLVGEAALVPDAATGQFLLKQPYPWDAAAALNET